MSILNTRVTPKDEILETMQQWLTDTLGDAVEMMMPELAEMFLEDGPLLMMDLRDALAAEEANALKDAAHSLKGSCASLGLVMLSQHYQVLESAAKSEDFNTAIAAMPATEAEFNQVIDLFKEIA